MSKSNSKFYILRKADTDTWMQTNGKFALNFKNVAVFSNYHLNDRLQHAKDISKKSGFLVVSEDLPSDF